MPFIADALLVIDDTWRVQDPASFLHRGPRDQATRVVTTCDDRIGDSNELCEMWTMVRLFDAQSGAQIDALRGPTSSLPEFGPLMVAFDSETRVVVTRESSKEVWIVTPNAIRERACRMANRDITGDELRRYLPSFWQRALRRGAACRGASQL